MPTMRLETIAIHPSNHAPLRSISSHGILGRSCKERMKTAHSLSRSLFISVPDLFKYDATADYVRAQAKLLESYGHCVTIIAQRTYACEIFRTCLPAEVEDDCEHSDLIVHFGIYDECLETLLRMKFRQKILYFHNITPPSLTSCLRTRELLQSSWTQMERVLELFDRAIANSPFTIDQVKSRGLLDACNSDHKIPWAWLPPRIAGLSDDAVRPQSNTVKDDFGLCMVGRLAAFKNSDQSIALFKELHRRDNRYHLTVIGKNAGLDGSEFNDSLGRALYEHGSINYLGQVDSFTKNTVVARSAASLNLSAHEGFCLPVYESIRHDTLTFYGGSEWLKGFLDCPELQLGIGDDLEYDAYRIHRILQNARHVKRLARHLRERCAIVDKLSSPRHQYKCITRRIPKATLEF